MKLERPIETPRLVLRSYRAADRDFSISLWCDAENGAYMSDPLFQNIDETYYSFFDEMEDDPDGYYLIAEEKATSEPIGTCCMFPEAEGWDVGYCIRKDHWREGLGSEMLEAMIGYIRAAGGKAITAEVADENAASTGLLRKHGFVPIKQTRYRKRGEEIVFDTHIHKLILQ